jgi:hypothetical protein
MKTRDQFARLTAALLTVYLSEPATWMGHPPVLVVALRAHRRRKISVANVARAFALLATRAEMAGDEDTLARAYELAKAWGWNWRPTHGGSPCVH